MRTVASRKLLILLLGPLFALLVAAGCTSGSGKTGAAPPPAGKVDLASAEFVGDSSCAACHPKEAAKQALTAHQSTLHLMDRDDLGKLAPPAGRVPGSDIVLIDQPNGRYALTVAGEKGEAMPVNFAIGSGKTGMTHVAVTEDNNLLELARSWFPAGHKWYTTPGHEKHKNKEVGILYDPAQARQCFACHAVTVPKIGISPAPQFFGVGCEACHGPASVHVEVAQRKGKVEGTIEKMGAWKAERLNELCGKCHRSQQSVQMKTAQADMTNRFQAYGLMKSRCFKEGGASLSCVSCHDPHSNTSHDPNTYESACLKCHATPSAAAPAVQKVGKPCPVNPRGGCIPCHMPSRPVFKNTDIPTRMADHYIRVHPQAR